MARLTQLELLATQLELLHPRFDLEAGFAGLAGEDPGIVFSEGSLLVPESLAAGHLAGNDPLLEAVGLSSVELRILAELARASALDRLPGADGATGPQGPPGPAGSGAFTEENFGFAGFTIGTYAGGAIGGRPGLNAQCAADFQGAHFCHMAEYLLSNSAARVPAAGARAVACRAVP